MLKVKGYIVGNKKKDITEKQEYNLDRQMCKIGIESIVRHSFNVYSSELIYFNIFGMGDSVTIDFTAQVPKRKLTKDTISKINEFCKKLEDMYKNILDELIVEVEAEDENDNRYEVEA
jgi:hypothetical protein